MRSLSHLSIGICGSLGHRRRNNFSPVFHIRKRPLKINQNQIKSEIFNEFENNYKNTMITFPNVIDCVTDFREANKRPIGSTPFNVITALGHRVLLVYCNCCQHTDIQLGGDRLFCFHVKTANAISFVHFCDKPRMETDHHGERVFNTTRVQLHNRHKATEL